MFRIYGIYDFYSGESRTNSLSWELKYSGVIKDICKLSLLFSLFLFLCGRNSAFAQQAIYIPPSGLVFLHPDDDVGVFGDVNNEGSLGSKPGAVFYFLGEQWRNSPAALLPGEGGVNAPGGLFCFKGVDKQTLIAGYNFKESSGPSFPHISIENKNGVRLGSKNDLHVRGALHFSQGFLLLNSANVLVDKSITGYYSESFIVTGNDMIGGSLYRKVDTEDSLLVFPVGTDQNNYSPFGIQFDQPVQMVIGADVFDHVRSRAISGEPLDEHYVQKTWQLYLAPKDIRSTVFLQYREANEGGRFSYSRDSSYVSRYSIKQKKWDSDSVSLGAVRSHLLTTGPLQKDTWLNERTFSDGLPEAIMTSTTWLSVSSKQMNALNCPVADFRLWAAQRYNYRWVQLFWRTRSELNVEVYEIQRRRENEDTFRTVATVASQNASGFSNHLLYYYFSDDNPSDGWTSYRLKLLNSGGCIAYTAIQEVPHAIEITVWPNPAQRNARVKVRGVKHRLTMQLSSVPGRILKTYQIDEDEIIPLMGLAAGVYILTFYDSGNHHQQIKSVKLIVTE